MAHRDAVAKLAGVVVKNDRQDGQDLHDEGEGHLVDPVQPEGENL